MQFRTVKYFITLSDRSLRHNFFFFLPTKAQYIYISRTWYAKSKNQMVKKTKSLCLYLQISPCTEHLGNWTTDQHDMSRGISTDLFKCIFKSSQQIFPNGILRLRPVQTNFNNSYRSNKQIQIQLGFLHSNEKWKLIGERFEFLKI